MFLLVSMVFALSINAQVEKDSVKVSGSVTFLSLTNSTLSGGYFSPNPSVRASISASYQNFAISVMRSSDLLDYKSGGNFFAISPNYAKTFGRFDAFVAVELDIFDHDRAMNLAAPYTVLSYNGVVHVETMLAYATLFQGGDINIQMLAISKSYIGLTFKAYVWNVNWNGNKKDAALEISKPLNDHFKLSVFGHLNDLSRDISMFGAVRVGYSF